jgi:hypothetical protein
VAVHAAAQGVQEQWPVNAVGDGAVHRAGDGWRQRDQDDLVALADHSQHSVAVLLADIGDVRRAGFEDPQPKEPEQTHQGEVRLVVGGTRGCQQGFELEVAQPEGG